MRRMELRRRLAMWLALAAFATLTTCATNPATGKRQIMLMSEAQEEALGRESDPEVSKEYGFYDSAALNRYVDSVGRKIARVSHRPGIEWHFKVVDSPVVNAFALPGGYIYVTRGILAHFNSEAELAAVLGHEIGHVTARHAASRYSKAQLAGLTLGLGGVLVPRFNQYSNLAGAGLGVLFLKFSRDDERQADDLGVSYAAAAGYDPRAAIEVFRMLELVSEGSGRSPLPNWLSTHPAPENREARIRENTASYQGTATVIAREAYLKQVNGIVFGDDPRQGFMEGSAFVHPQLGFRVGFPPGWQIQNTRQFVLAAEPDEAAALKLEIAGSSEAPESCASRLAAQEGARVQGGRKESVHRLPAFLALFEYPATQERPAVTRLNGFIRHGEAVYRVQGMTRPETMEQYQSVFLESIRSFRALAPGEARDRKPDILGLESAPRAMPLRDAIRLYSTGAAAPEAVAVLNHLPLDSEVPAGTIMKVVLRQR